MKSCCQPRITAFDRGIMGKYCLSSELIRLSVLDRQPFLHVFIGSVDLTDRIIGITPAAVLVRYKRSHWMAP